MTRLPNELAVELAELGVATLHEANGRRGLVDSVRLLVGEPFAGPAVTVALPAGDNLGIHLALETADRGTVVCVSSGGGGRFGVYGELLHVAATARGIAGVVIDDGIRDFRDLSGPPGIAARGVTARGTVKRRLRQTVGSDIGIGGVLVRSRDWIVCDLDGVLVIPKSRVNEIVAAAGERVVKEDGFRRHLREGTLSRKLFDLPSEATPSIT